jgi:outer membrane protein W
MNKVKLTALVILISISTMFAQSKMGVGVNGVFAASSGDMKDLFDTGFGGLASLNYNASESIQLSLTAGYIKFGFNNDYINDQLKEAGSNMTVDVDASLSVIPIMIGGKYFLSSSDFKPYLAADAGVHIMEITSDKVTVGGQQFDAVGSASETKGAFDIGVGFLMKLSPSINLDVNGKLNINGLQIKKEKSFSSGGAYYEESSESNAMYFTIAAGLSFAL